MSGIPLLIVAGESSGDQRAARLLAALAARLPGVTAFGLGSDSLRAAGMETLADSHEIAVIGIAEALEVLPRAAEIMDRLLREVERRRPAAAVLVDFPDFNLRLARKLAWLGIPVVYYVSPQVWAWRRGRVRTIADTVDLMLVLFPFEAAFYAAHRVPVVHVGHPLVDEVPALPQAWARLRRGAHPERYRLALLPGSRRREVAVLLPILLAAARAIADELPVEITIVRAPSVPEAAIAGPLAAGGTSARVVDTDRLAAIADSHLALCASGTVTLEAGLLGTPMIVAYRLAPTTYALARALVRVPHISLVNLVLERRAVPELVQRGAEPRLIAAEALRLLDSRAEIDRQREALAGLRSRLGAPGASARAAEQVALLLERRRSA
jgi:lipid-A-disaccharide synthase